jgi:hypothetical protein
MFGHRSFGFRMKGPYAPGRDCKRQHRPQIEPLEDRCQPAITAAVGLYFSMTQGVAASVVVATFEDPNPLQDLKATIEWGDGTSSASTASVSSTVTVAWQMSLAAHPIAAAAGAAFVDIAVASFTDADPAAAPAQFTAKIIWGDGYESDTTVIGVGQGAFEVLGTHTYVDAGSYTFRVDVTGSGSDSGMASGTATVTEEGPGSLEQPSDLRQAADISFWGSNDGRSLIRQFDGGPSSPALASWLALAVPNIFGDGSGGDDVTGKTNAQVAVLVGSLSRARPRTVAAQVMATALNVYATTRSLGGTAARREGFHVTVAGLGLAVYRVGPRALAIGLRDSSAEDVDQILEAADQRALAGVVDAGKPALRRAALQIFSAINGAS